MANEKAFFFRDGDKPLFGVLYGRTGEDDAADSARDSRRGIVICNSLFEEKSWCERVFANMGRHLAGEGYDVLVFDYFGYGNSAGSSIDVDVMSLERDIKDACDLLADSGVDRITLVGVRWGGALACRAAAAREDVDSIFLINPVTNWSCELSKALRANVAGQYAMFNKAAMTRDEIIEDLSSGGSCVRSGYRMNNIDGYCFSQSFLRQSKEVSLPVAIPARVKSVAIFDIAPTPTSKSSDNDKLALAFQSAGLDCDSVTLADDNAFWLNHHIFTSVTPGLYKEIAERICKLERSQPPQKQAAGDPHLTVVDTVLLNGVRESVVRFPTQDGYQTYGLVYMPEDRKVRDIAFVFSHGGLVGMTGAYRFYTRAARRFAAEGYPCMCFDPHGMGRAQGAPENKDKIALFRDINLGLFADDVGDAVSFLEKMIGKTQVVLFGVCGGAITNLITQSRFDNITGSIQLSTPVMLPGVGGAVFRMSPGFAKFYLGMYARKFFNPMAWWRFLTFQSEYDRIFKALKTTAGEPFKRRGPPRSESGSTPDSENLANAKTAGENEDDKGIDSAQGQPHEGDGLRLNEVFLDAYRKIVQRGDRIIFFYGDSDNFKWEFYREFAEKYPGDVVEGEGLVEVKEIEQANHMYSLREWQDQVCEYCLEWVERVRTSQAITADPT
jgi:pimeloyl-ACP methyl ester carboxylesterase